MDVIFNVHLVSDSTGETLNAVVKAACAQFERIRPVEHSYFLVRTPRQLDRVLVEIESAPGIVMSTVVKPELREQLESFCAEHNIPYISVLDPVFAQMTNYLGLHVTEKIGAQRELNENYFHRIAALNYAMAQDDGANLERLKQADVILVGVSRTSKTPTCIYLGNRSVFAANVPIIREMALPDTLDKVEKALIVGLRIAPDRLLHIRKSRLANLNEQRSTDYTAIDAIRAELIYANRIFERKGWPVLDVTRRSIEETAASILNLLSEKRGHSVQA